MTADHPRPVAEPMAHHSAMDTNSNTKYPGNGGASRSPSLRGRRLLQFGLRQFQHRVGDRDGVVTDRGVGQIVPERTGRSPLT